MAIHWHIGDVITKLRKDKGLKQLALAKDAGVSLATISRLEDGKSYKPETLAKVAHALGYELSALHEELEQLQRTETQRSFSSAAKPNTANDSAGQRFLAS